MCNLEATLMSVVMRTQKNGYIVYERGRLLASSTDRWWDNYVSRFRIWYPSGERIISSWKIFINRAQWRNYRPRSPRNAGGPDEMGAQNFRTDNYSTHGRFFWICKKNSIYYLNMLFFLKIVDLVDTFILTVKNQQLAVHRAQLGWVDNFRDA